jgi:hypothetical protein
MRPAHQVLRRCRNDFERLLLLPTPARNLREAGEILHSSGLARTTAGPCFDKQAIICAETPLFRRSRCIRADTHRGVSPVISRDPGVSRPRNPLNKQKQTIEGEHGIRWLGNDGIFTRSIIAARLPSGRLVGKVPALPCSYTGNEMVPDRAQIGD